MESRLSFSAALRSKKTVVAFLALIAASLLFIPANAFIQARFPDRPIVPDLAFTLFPPIPWLAFATDPLLLASIALLSVQAVKVDRAGLPFYLASAAALYFARAFLMILTPLGRPTGNLDHYGLLRYLGFLQHGMFPSGHQMLSTLCWVSIDGVKAPRLRRAAAILCAIEAVALIASRGHYSIDVVGGALVAWFIYEKTSKFKARMTIGLQGVGISEAVD